MGNLGALCQRSTVTTTDQATATSDLEWKVPRGTKRQKLPEAVTSHPGQELLRPPEKTKTCGDEAQAENKASGGEVLPRTPSWQAEL